MGPDLAAIVERLGRLEEEQRRLSRENRILRWAAACLAAAAAALALCVAGLWSSHAGGQARLRAGTVEADLVCARRLVIEASPGTKGRGVWLFADDAEAVLQLRNEQGKTAAELRVGHHAGYSSIITAADRVDRASLKLTGYDGEAGAALEVYPALLDRGNGWETTPAARLKAGDKREGWWHLHLGPDDKGTSSVKIIGPGGKELLSRR